MTVAELIAELQKHEPSLPVIVYDSEYEWEVGRLEVVSNVSWETHGGDRTRRINEVSTAKAVRIT